MAVSNQDIYEKLLEIEAQMGQVVTPPPVVEKEDIGVPAKVDELARSMLDFPWMDGHGDEVEALIKQWEGARLLDPAEGEVSDLEIELYGEAEEFLQQTYSQDMENPYPVEGWYPPWNTNQMYRKRFIVQWEEEGQQVLVRPYVNRPDLDHWDRGAAYAEGGEVWNFVKEIMIQALKVDDGRTPHGYF